MKIIDNVAAIIFHNNKMLFVWEMKKDSPVSRAVDKGKNVLIKGPPSGKRDLKENGHKQTVAEAIINEVAQEASAVVIPETIKTLFKVQKHDISANVLVNTTYVTCEIEAQTEFSPMKNDESVIDAGLVNINDAVTMLEQHQDLSRREPLIRFLKGEFPKKNYYYERYEDDEIKEVISFNFSKPSLNCL